MPKHVILISGNTSKSEEEYINSLTRNYYQTAANTLSSSIFCGLKEIFKGKLSLVSSPLIPSFPKYFRKFIYKGKERFEYYGSDAYGTKFITIPLFKLFFKQKSILNVLCSKVYRNDEDYIIIIYGIHTPYLKSAVEFKQKYPKTKLCLVVPDLPIYMSSSKNLVYLFLKKVDSVIQNKLLNSIDSYVFLTEFMKSQFDLHNKNSIVVEGIYNPVMNTWDEIKNPIIKDNVILYTGTLDKRYGMQDLLSAFEEIPNAELWICGDGDLRDTVVSMISRGHKIKYWGHVSQQEVIKLQKQAKVLVNPRPSLGEFTKYSFPSKTIEYLASGTPCVMRKLPGIPAEYDDYIFYTKDDSVQSLRDTICDVLSMSQMELNAFGEKASDFIKKQKNSRRQCEKILKLVLE